MKVSVVTVLVSLLVLSADESLAEDADWTVIAVLSARYVDMQDNLRQTGSSDRVNVVVLHDQDGDGMEAYRLLPDTNADNPAGQCCPDDKNQACCGVQSLSLSDMGITGRYVYSQGVLDAFLEYVQQEFPAKRYLITLRGQMDGTRLLMHNNSSGGLTIVELAEILGRFKQRNGNRNIDVLNVGLCLGGVIDWAYAVSPSVDYYVGAANYTNSPVSVRWRIYRWARELIVDPTQSGQDIAPKIIDIFSESSEYCETQANGCSNAPYEPWTVAATDLSAMKTVATSTRELVCALLDDFDSAENDYLGALSDTRSYGNSGGSWQRKDLGQFAENLRETTDDPTVKAAADKLARAVGDAVVKAASELSLDDSLPYGLSAMFNRSQVGRPASGDFQFEAMWQLLMNEVHGTGSPPEISKLVIEPNEVEVEQGRSITLTARAFSEEYGPMCVASVDWAPDLDEVGTLRNPDDNPVVFDAVLVGNGTLTAQYGGEVAEATISVVAESTLPVDDDGAEGNSTDGNGDDGGPDVVVVKSSCSVAAGRTRPSVPLAALVWLACMLACWRIRRRR